MQDLTVPGQTLGTSYRQITVLRNQWTRGFWKVEAMPTPSLPPMPGRGEHMHFTVTDTKRLSWFSKWPPSPLLPGRPPVSPS